MALDPTRIFQSGLFDRASTFRDELLQNEAEAIGSMIDQWGTSLLALEERAQAISSDYNSGQLPKSALREQARIKQLQYAIIDELDRLESYSFDSTLQLKAQSASSAYLHAEELTAQGIPLQARQQLMATWEGTPFAAVQAVVGRARQADSPLNRLYMDLASGNEKTAQRMMDSFTANILQGKHPTVYGRQLAEQFAVPLGRAMTIARTEQLNAYRTGTLLAWQQNSHLVKGWKWLSAMGRSKSPPCVTCLRMHGRVFKLEQPMPAHPNCRCTQVPITKTLEELGYSGFEGAGDRSSDLLEEGDGVKWLESQPESVQRQTMPSAMFKAWKGGSVTIDDMVGVFGNREWGEFVSTKSLVSILGQESASEYYSPVYKAIVAASGAPAPISEPQVAPSAVNSILNSVFSSAVVDSPDPVFIEVKNVNNWLESQSSLAPASAYQYKQLVKGVSSQTALDNLAKGINDDLLVVPVLYKNTDDFSDILDILDSANKKQPTKLQLQMKATKLKSDVNYHLSFSKSKLKKLGMKPEAQVLKAGTSSGIAGQYHLKEAEVVLDESALDELTITIKKAIGTDEEDFNYLLAKASKDARKARQIYGSKVVVVFDGVPEAKMKIFEDAVTNNKVLSGSSFSVPEAPATPATPAEAPLTNPISTLSVSNTTTWTNKISVNQSTATHGLERFTFYKGNQRGLDVLKNSVDADLRDAKVVFLNTEDPSKIGDVLDKTFNKTRQTLDLQLAAKTGKADVNWHIGFRVGELNDSIAKPLEAKIYKSKPSIAVAKGFHLETVNDTVGPDVIEQIEVTVKKTSKTSDDEFNKLLVETAKDVRNYAKTYGVSFRVSFDGVPDWKAKVFEDAVNNNKVLTTSLFEVEPEETVSALPEPAAAPTTRGLFKTGFDIKSYKKAAKYVDSVNTVNGDKEKTDRIMKKLGNVEDLLPDLEDFGETSYDVKYELQQARNSPNVRADKAARQAIYKVNQTWANSSLNTSIDSWNVQRAIAEEFGLQDSYKATIDRAKRWQDNKLGTGAGSRIERDANEAWKKQGTLLRKVIRAMYNATQDELQAAGLEEISLFRGQGMKRSDVKKLVPDLLNDQTKSYENKMSLQPASSFAAHLGTAESFSTGYLGAGVNDPNDPIVPLVFRTTVPRQMVLSTAGTGLGTFREYEFVVLESGGTWEVGVRGLFKAR